MTTGRARTASHSPVPAASTGGPAAVLGGLPLGIRQELIDELNKIERHFREGRWEPAELDGGRLCEIVYSIVRGELDGKIPSKASKPTDLVGAIRALEGVPASTGPRSFRITIPRALLGIVDVRNDRDVGHIGGEVSSNHMDASYVLAGAKWLVAELVRYYHQVDTATATTFVEALIERDTPAVWQVAGTKRLLLHGVSMPDRTLVALDSTAGPVHTTDLREWTGYSNATLFRQSILVELHRADLIHYDRKTGLVYISPLGAKRVADHLHQWVA